MPGSQGKELLGGVASLRAGAATLSRLHSACSLPEQTPFSSPFWSQHALLDFVFFVRVTGTLPSTVRLSQAGSLLRGRREIPNNFRVIF